MSALKEKSRTPDQQRLVANQYGREWSFRHPVVFAFGSAGAGAGANSVDLDKRSAVYAVLLVSPVGTRYIDRGESLYRMSVTISVSFVPGLALLVPCVALAFSKQCTGGFQRLSSLNILHFRRRPPNIRLSLRRRRTTRMQLTGCDRTSLTGLG